MHSSEHTSAEGGEGISAAAARWLAARDRGFTGTEQDAFGEWLSANPRHRIEFARLSRTWSSLDSLAVWQPADGTAPNPNVLAPSPARRRSRVAWFAALAGLGVAAAITLLALRPPSGPSELAGGAPGVRVIPQPERQALADGSVAEANHGARFELAFREQERRVRLQEGEAHFSVVKDPARPFVVEVDGVLVRAVGTAFNVRREPDRVEVLVTEGTVQIERPAALPVAVTRGERARLESGRPLTVTTESAETIARELAWRSVRLEFEGLPLQMVVNEFNLRNSRQLVVGDAAAGRVKVAGTFRADEPEAFARLLELGFHIAVDRQEHGAWILRSAHGEKK